jgi:hypothetical protein
MYVEMDSRCRRRTRGYDACGVFEIPGYITSFVLALTNSNWAVKILEARSDRRVIWML